MIDHLMLTSPVVASLALLAVAVYIGHRRRLGPTADWVEVVRATTLPIIDPVIERAVGGAGSQYKLLEREYAGTIAASPEKAERILWEVGCRRNLMAALKTTESREETGSWVYRGPEVGSEMQLHVMLFEAEQGTDVYAHREFSSALRWLWTDPTVLRKHYGAAHYSWTEGEELVHELVDAEHWE